VVNRAYLAVRANGRVKAVAASLQLADREKRMESPGQTAAVFHLGYRPWLDGLRGVAILLVLAFHLGLLPGGSLGVDVFFVLSGFLITTLLVEEWQNQRAISLKNFYLRRALRLLPAFLTLLLICFLSSLFLESAEAVTARRREILVAGCYIANWPLLHGTGMELLGHTWSLSVEEQFYLLWPMLLLGMLRLRLSRPVILTLVGVGVIASASLRLVLYRLHCGTPAEKGANIIRLYMGLDTRADALLVGCLIGLLVAWSLLPESQCFTFWTGATSIVSVAVLGYLAWNRCLDHSQYYHGLFTGVALMVAVLMVRLLQAPSGPGLALLESRPLVGVGRISYGLYLYHIPVIHWLRAGSPRLGWTETILAAGLTFAAALLSSIVIERPCLRLKERIRPGTRAATETTARVAAQRGGKGEARQVAA
jgi:peptidoglycan/LPS O-acetylase OafA/YrhL